MLLQHALSLQELRGYKPLLLLPHLLSCLQFLMLQLLQSLNLLMVLSFPGPVARVCRPLSESKCCLLYPSAILLQLLCYNADEAQAEPQKPLQTPKGMRP